MIRSGVQKRIGEYSGDLDMLLNHYVRCVAIYQGAVREVLQRLQVNHP